MKLNLFDGALSKIDRGKLGLNIGLPHGYEKLVEFIPNIQQGTNFLLGGETSSGKTAFADNTFLYNPYDYLQSGVETKMEMKIIYFSFEIEKNIKIVKGICRKLYMDYGLNVDVNYILSRGKNRISTEIYNKVLTCRKYFEKLEDILDIIDVSENPTGINKYIQKIAEELYIKVEHSQYHVEYIPKNPNLYLMVLIDHVALSKKESGYNKKENIDKLSEYAIGWRNKFQAITIFIQQFNRDISSVDRIQVNRLVPQLSDFKDSGCTSEDANIIFGLFNPHKYNLKEIGGYSVNNSSPIRTLSVLKNRDGEADVIKVFDFIGTCGYFKEK